MNISVVGTGYVGLVTGVCLASKGHKVICVDKRKDIVDKINNGETPIYEQGLQQLMEQAVKTKRLLATTELETAIINTDISIIAVGTPFGNDKIDLSYIEKSAGQIGSVLKDKASYHVVCVKSTVIPTTTDTVVKNVLEKASGKKVGEFGLTMNPEFLREGKAVADFMYPDRIVIGAYDNKSFEAMEKVYKEHFDAPIMRVNLRTAEMIKYSANALLATLISFSNEIASICEKTGGIDVKDVLEGVTLDKRFNPRNNGELVNPEMINYLRAGCGFGGSCFPKDVKALISYSKSIGCEAKIISSTIDINKKQPLKLVDKLEKILGNLSNKKVAVLGLAFKPDTDDIRESPSMPIINKLLEKGAIVYGVDPIAINNIEQFIPQNGANTYYTTDYKYALKDADAAILVTSWAEFVNIPAKEFSLLMRTPILIDGRRSFDKNAFQREGIIYYGVGLS